MNFTKFLNAEKFSSFSLIEITPTIESINEIRSSSDANMKYIFSLTKLQCKYMTVVVQTTEIIGENIAKY